MRFLTAILLSIVMPNIGFAQAAVDVFPANPALARAQQGTLTDQLLHTRDGLGGNAGMLPLWGTPDGHVLALVAFGSSNGAAPTLPQSPQIGSAVDLQLVDVTSFFTGGVSLRVNDNARAYAKFGQGIVLTPLYATAPSPGCSATAAFGISGLCVNESAVGHIGSVSMGTDFNAGALDLDLNYGLSWLRLGDQPANQRPAWDLFANLGNEALPTLVIPGIEFTNVQNSSLGAQGRWRLNDAQSLDLGAAISRIQFETPGAPLLPSLNQAALSLGLHRGDFSGVVVGRILGAADSINGNQRWSSLDLGISWRSPWRGVFSVGAQNIWSSGNLPALTDPSAHEADINQARVPYVQYHQDL
ncbi:MAG: hypothetical protein P4L92_20995 [Rudaea sp.]|nr:hypothetical protein [Rudaea sp.]